MCVFAVLANICVKIHLDNRNKSYKACEALVEAFRGKLWQTSAFLKDDFREKKTNQWKAIEA